MFRRHRRFKEHRYSWLRNWTVRSQIHLYSILLIVLSIASTSSLIFGYLTFKKDSIKTSTLYIQQKETTHQITTYNNLQTRSFTGLLDFSYNALNTLNRLNHFIEYQQHSFNIKMPTDCINNPKLWDSYIFQCELCYKFCNQTNDPNNFKQFFQLVSLITETLPISNMYRQTFFTSTDSAQFFTVYKGGDYTKFVAHIRPWYINHLNRTKYENHKFYISDLYLDWIKKLAIAFTVSLTNLNNSMIGVLGYDLSFDLLPAFFDSRLSMDIVNSTGYLLVSSLYETYKVPTLIYNTTLTGFTIKDWTRLKLFGDQGTIGNGSLRVKNKNTNIIYEVSVYKLYYPELYIIIYSADDKFLQSQQTLLANLDQFEQFILMETLYYSLAILMSVLLLQFIIIRYALSNLQSLVILTKQKIFLQFKIKNRRITLHSDKKDTISKLCTAFTRLNQNLTNFKWKKSRFCQHIERIHYPHKNREMDTLVLEELYGQIENSSDQIWNMNFSEPQMFLQEVYSRRLTHIQKSLKSMFVQKYGTL